MFYTTKKALLITSRVEIIYKKEFASVAVNEESQTFVLHVVALKAPLAKMTIHYLQATQIAALKQDEAPTKVPPEYVNYADIFSFNLAIELAENTGINKYVIKLQDGQQPPYKPTYISSLVELEILKIYIKIQLITGFIQPYKFPTIAPILIDKKADSSLYLCVNYRDLNNLNIKNWYPLPSISRSLDLLGRVKRFTQLDLTTAYHQIRIKEGDK